MRKSSHVLERQAIDFLKSALERLDKGFGGLPAFGASQHNYKAIERVLMEVAGRLKQENPYFHPLYAGQMLKPPHPVARAAYALAMWLNPNNYALEASKASSPMEKEAVAEIARMFGWQEHLGHLTGGGTMANLEALWVAGQLRPGGVVVASRQAHYTHQRVSSVLGLKFEPIPVDDQGRMNIGALEERLRKGDVGTVVATMGTTATGSVDPLSQILKLRQQYDFRVHADAAYGGYFKLVDNLGTKARQAFGHLREVDSVVIDPHKHGLQPYGCGCVIFRDPGVDKLYKHNSPYTYFSSEDLHLGEISLECSRSGAIAVGLWATMKLLPLTKGGEFAKMLGQGRDAALSLYRKLEADQRFVTAFKPELDIVVWAPKAAKVSEASNLSRRTIEEAAKRNLHLALADLPTEFFKLGSMERDQDTVTALRSVLMKPEHLEWLDRLWAILDESVNAANS